MRLSDKISAIKPSATLEISAKAKELKKKGVNVISFGAGEPDFDTPENIKLAAIKAIKEGKTKYTPPAGILELREAVAEVYSKEYGVNFSVEEVIISCGAKHSIYNVLQVLLNNGDEVIIPAPYWVSYPVMVKLAGGVPVFVESSFEDEYRVRAEKLKDKITSKTKAIILNSPSNPSGMLIPKDELEKLVKIIAENDIYVISDDIYHKLIYEKEFYNLLMVDNSLKENVIIINGVSKTYSMTGWRIGFTIAQKDIISAINKIQSQSTSNPTSISQYAALEAITGDQSSVIKMRETFRKRREIAVKMINNIRGIKCLNPEGTFYLFPDINEVIRKSNLKDSVEFCSKLLENSKVAVVPGSAFGIENTFRMSFALSEDDIIEGIKRIGEFVSSIC